MSFNEFWKSITNPKIKKDEDEEIVSYIIETSSGFKYVLLQSLRILLVVFSLCIALVSINVQGESLKYFTFDSNKIALFIASIFVILTTFLYEYSEYLKSKKQPHGFIFGTFLVCMLFMAFGTFSGAYEFSQKTKKIKSSEITKNDTRMIIYKSFEDEEIRKKNEYLRTEKDYNRADAEYEKNNNKETEKERKKYSNKLNSLNIELNSINNDREKFLTKNPDFDSHNTSENNKDVFEFLSPNNPNFLRGLYQFFLVIIFDLFTPIVLSIALFKIIPVFTNLKKKKEEETTYLQERNFKRLESNRTVPLINDAKEETKTMPAPPPNARAVHKFYIPMVKYVQNMLIAGTKQLKANDELCHQIGIPPRLGTQILMILMSFEIADNGPFIYEENGVCFTNYKISSILNQLSDVRNKTEKQLQLSNS